MSSHRQAEPRSGVAGPLPRFGFAEAGGGTRVARLAAAPALAALSVVALSLGAGGFFPVAWGWSAVLLIWVSCMALLLRDRIALARREWLVMGGMAGLVGWTALSGTWSTGWTAPVLQTEMLLVYLSALTALLLLTRPKTAAGLLGTVTVTTAAVVMYALAGRLLPGAPAMPGPGVADGLSAFRLSEPLGYWNALGLMASMAILLALGQAAGARAVGWRAASAAVVPALTVALYFTYSRGAIAALGLGLLVALLIDPGRLRLACLGLWVLVPTAAGLAVGVGSSALTHVGASQARMSGQGARLAAVLVVCALAAAAGPFVLRRPAFDPDRLRLPRPGRRAVAGGLGLLLCLLVGLSVLAGSPAQLVSRGLDSFVSTSGYGGPQRAGHQRGPATADLNARFSDLSGHSRLTLWQDAWRDFTAHPLLGSGGGSFAQHWVQDRPTDLNVRDAHSLYMQALAELGPIGLILLAVVLGVPLAAGLRVRRLPLVPAALGAYAAYLIHAATDWDWQMPAVTLVALCCAAFVLVRARDQLGSRPRELRTGVRRGMLAALALAGAFAFVGLQGNRQMSAAQSALDTHRWGAAERQALAATRWEPWSTHPWLVVGQARLAAGDPAGARAAYRDAIAKEPTDWQLWFELARASTGAQQQAALSQATRLNPRSREIAIFLRQQARAARS
ncbi:MAG: O-antigen ligase family protein [Gaiellales bacterium]